MKNLFFILLISISFFACKNSENKSNNSDSTQNNSVFSNNKELKVMVYYFFGERRCPTCISIEENVKNVLNTQFKSQIDNKLIAFEGLNFEDKQNESIVKKYYVSTSALHIVTMKNGKENDLDLTNFAFTYSKSEPEVFKQKLADTLNYFLNQ